MEFFAIAAILGYSAAFYLLASRLLAPEGPNRKLVIMASVVAVVGHGIALGSGILMETGQNFSLTNVLSLLIWIITLSITVMMPRLKVLAVAPAVYVCAILSVIALWLLPPEYRTNFELKPALLIHVVLSLLAYAAMLLATLYAIQLAGIDRRLKQRKILMSPALPPLMTVEKQLYQLIWAGFLLLSAGLFTGWLFLDNFLGDGMGHKAILSMIAWLVYAVLLARHHTKGTRIRTAVSFSFVGAGLLTLAYFGARVVKELILM